MSTGDDEEVAALNAEYAGSQRAGRPPEQAVGRVQAATLEEVEEMRYYDVTLKLVVAVEDDIAEDDLEEEIEYQVERYSDQVVMVGYHEQPAGTIHVR